MGELRQHKLRLAPAWGKAGRARRAQRMTDKLAAKGYKTVRYDDGGTFGNSYIYVEGVGPGPLDLWGILERFVTAVVLLAAGYYFYTRILHRGG